MDDWKQYDIPGHFKTDGETLTISVEMARLYAVVTAIHEMGADHQLVRMLCKMGQIDHDSARRFYRDIQRELTADQFTETMQFCKAAAMTAAIRLMMRNAETVA